MFTVVADGVGASGFVRRESGNGVVRFMIDATLPPLLSGFSNQAWAVAASSLPPVGLGRLQGDAADHYLATYRGGLELLQYSQIFIEVQPPSGGTTLSYPVLQANFPPDE